jgi:hypothetical protein
VLNSYLHVYSFSHSTTSFKTSQEQIRYYEPQTNCHPQSFNLNNKTYIWEAESKHHQHKHLYEIIETSKPAPPSAKAEASASTPETEVIAAPIISIKKAREVARYSQKHVHGHGHAGGKEGLLVIDSGEIGELVGVLTLCAMLEVRDLPEL